MTFEQNVLLESIQRSSIQSRVQIIEPKRWVLVLIKVHGGRGDEIDFD
jgi:hypothetical protein